MWLFRKLRSALSERPFFNLGPVQGWVKAGCRNLCHR